ncbi:MAG: sulfite exporter TauE/SafE family protein [Methyloceanibacter sp.]|uniref:sulfite exporter TauE/SafE family protein n=1 Tax=Methyloceanibacter sp. TaxID=1965321 RepID=UPI003D6C7366
MVDLSWAAALLPLAGAGFGVGFLVGLTGVGGGALMTPLLISTFGVSPAVAVGTDLLYAAVTKTVGGWRHHVAENVNWPIVFRLAAGSIPAAIVLLAIMASMPLNTVAMAHWIRYGLAFALPVSAIAIVLYPILMKGHKNGNADGKDPPRTLVTVLFGAALGLLVTLTSVGAGAIGVVVLAALFPLLPARRIVGTDIAHAVPLTLVAGAGHLGLGHVDAGILLALLCGSIPGILFGARLAGVAPDWLLRPLLALTLCYAAYALLNK